MKPTLIKFVYSQIFLLCLLLTKPATSSVLDDKNNTSMVTMEQIPYGFRTADGKSTGMLYEILNYIITESSIEQPNNLLPLKRILASMSTRKNTCSLLGNSPYVVDNYDLVEPLGLSMNIGILPRNGVALVDYSSLKGLTLAVPLGIHFDGNFNRDDNLSIVSPRNYVNALKMLKNGQVDAVAGAIPTLRLTGTKEGMTANDFGRPLIVTRGELILVCNHPPPIDVRKKLKNAVIKLKSNGAIRKVFDDYYSNKSD